MADPPTPPHTPASSSKGTSNVNQGKVNNGGIRNNGGVVTGNVAGFNTIVGTLNITVDSASNLTDNIQSFTARVATAAERLRDVENRIRATSQLLGSIRDLVIARAAKEDIQINRDFRVQDGDGTGTAGGVPTNDGTRGGNAGGEGERDIDAGQAPTDGATTPEPSILEKPCFRDLVNASKSAADRFDIINTRIREAFNRIEPMHRERAKVEISEEDRQTFFLTEKDIDDMERHIESHKLEVHIALTAFEATMGDKRSEEIQSIILDMFREIKRIGEYFFNRSHGPLPAPPPGRRRGTRGLNAQDDDRFGEGPFHPDPYLSPYDRQSTYPYIRPFDFPDLSRLTSLYLGWTFTKGRPPYLQINPQSNQPSWRWAICSQMALSTEELFLKVLAQTTKRSKLRRSIQDDCKDLLRTSVQRMLVDNLLRDQNMSLGRQHPYLELKLAGLSAKRKRVGFFSEETKSIDVILKTEWSPDAPMHDPIRPGPGGGGPSAPPPPWGGGPGGGVPGGGGDGDDGGDPFSGSGRPLGTGFHGGPGGGGSGPGYPPGRGPRHTGQDPPPPPPPGGSGSHSGQKSHKVHPPPGIHYSPPRTTPSKSAPEVVSREPRMYVVRKKKGKAAASDSESPRRIFVRDKRGILRISTENRRPSSSHTDDIDGVPVSAHAVHHSTHPPPQPPKPAVHSHAQAAYYIPAEIRPQTRVYPPPQPAPETVYSSSLSSSSSSDSIASPHWRPRTQLPRHYHPSSMQIHSRDMTREQEKKVIDEIFAEWEDGVHGKPTTTTTTTRPLASQNLSQKQTLEQEERKKLNVPSALVPQIGPTRRMMMEVEHEAQRHESIEATTRESHRLEKPSHHTYTREPRRRRRRSFSLSRSRPHERDRERSFTRIPRQNRGFVFLDRHGNAHLDDEGYDDIRWRFADPEGYYRHVPGPSVMVPGPSRSYGAPGPEIHARESYAHPDVADMENSPPGREFFDPPVVEHIVEPAYPENRERRREYLQTPVVEHGNMRRTYGDRGRDYFDTHVVEHLDMRRAHPESHGRVRVVPPHMERERERVFVAEAPERPSRERGRVNVETRSPRVELYESVYDSSD